MTAFATPTIAARDAHEKREAEKRGKSLNQYRKLMSKAASTNPRDLDEIAELCQVLGLTRDDFDRDAAALAEVCRLEKEIVSDAEIQATSEKLTEKSKAIAKMRDETLFGMEVEANQLALQHSSLLQNNRDVKMRISQLKKASAIVFDMINDVSI